MPLTPDIPADFHKQFAAWVRIEPRCRSNDFARGIQARIADPLWMLARQWQVGEFQGEDAGSPVQVELTYETQPIETIRMGNRLAPLHNEPLEMQVEQERLELTWRTRVQIGQTFERLLHQQLPGQAEALIRYYRQQFPIALPTAPPSPIDRATSRLIEFMQGRVVDGKLVLAADSLPLEANLAAGFTQAQLAQLQTILSTLKTRYAQYGLTPSAKRASEAWRSQQLQYQFELNEPLPFPGWPQIPGRPVTPMNAPVNLLNQETSSLIPGELIPFQPASQTRLVAQDYRNGDLDWYTFAVQAGIQGNWTQHSSIRPYPTALRITGTSPRWWAFEDAHTDFGDLDVATPDLAKLMLMEFVLIYGDDWFTVPLSIAMNRLARVEALKVTNVFNEPPLEVQSARQVEGSPLQRWELFTLSDATAPLAAGVGDVLLIPPVAGFREESLPLEEIRFLRDEGANMVWAVEHRVLNGLGRPVDGFEAQLERLARRREQEIAELQKELAGIQRRLQATQRLVMTEGERLKLERQAAGLQRRIDELERGAPPPSAGEGLHYRLASLVPENWIPFMPQDARPVIQVLAPPLGGLPGAGMGNLDDPVIRLRRAQMLRNTVAEEPEPIEAMSRLLELAGEPLLWLEEATVPRAGLRLQLTHQRMRWVDGKTYVWVGRKVLMGRGEGSSGLRFDFLEALSGEH